MYGCQPDLALLAWPKTRAYTCTTFFTAFARAMMRAVPRVLPCWSAPWRSSARFVKVVNPPLSGLSLFEKTPPVTDFVPFWRRGPFPPLEHVFRLRRAEPNVVTRSSLLGEYFLGGFAFMMRSIF